MPAMFPAARPSTLPSPSPARAGAFAPLSGEALGEAAHRVLEHVFGYPAFRGEQRQIVEHVAGGGDALVLMPTGGGKSLCYQIPALLRHGTAIVVSPLIALMQDQVSALVEAGVRAAFLNSSLEMEAARAVERALWDGELELLYVAPERLMTPRFLDQLDHLRDTGRLALFAIDEAHCVSQWGHDFRPEYLQLSILPERYPAIPRIALTATADRQTREEIAERLNLQAARRFISSFDRPNIRYTIVEKNDPRRQLLDFIREECPGQAGIVYCLSRRKVEETAAWLQEQGLAALPYHAGMTQEIRAEHQSRFLREDGLIMVATIAFGMGIDKPDVRFVAHLDLPKSVEGYYQETGRAGRDGEPAEAWMCYGFGDLATLIKMIEDSEAGEDRKRLERRKLDALLGYAETVRCRRQVLLAGFGETYPQPCGNCDNCLEPPQTWDGTEAAQKALSCVYRTGQRFGVGYVIDVLRGSANERITQSGHNHLSTFGIGADMDVNTWRSVFRQLVAAGLLDVDMQGYGALHLTDAARPILRGETRIQLRRDLRTTRKRTSVRGDSRSDSRGSRDIDLSPAAQPRFEALRELRMQLAREQNVPAYMIFSNATLRDIAEEDPNEMDELATISGVGAAKLERYGEAVLDTLAVMR